MVTPRWMPRRGAVTQGAGSLSEWDVGFALGVTPLQKLQVSVAGGCGPMVIAPVLGSLFISHVAGEGATALQMNCPLAGWCSWHRELSPPHSQL